VKLGLWDYIREAFSAKPIGMFIPPNWIGVGLFLVLGLVSPGFLVLGAGLELGYLYMLATHPRFQRFVSAVGLVRSQKEWQKRMDGAVSRLSPGDRQRFLSLQDRCRAILAQQGDDSGSAIKAQGVSLGRLMWIYMTLLATRQSISRVVGDSVDAGIQSRLDKLQVRLKADHLGGDLERSLAGQVDILQQRIVKQKEASDKVAFLDAELARIQEQVELIREQGVLATDPETVSERIDQVSATLGGTAQWLREQQQLYGKVEDLLIEPPPVAIPDAPQAEEQKQ